MRYSFLALLTAAIPLVSSPATAQIIPDNSLGDESSIVRQDTINNLESDVIEGGALRENNLFHSFQEFQINAGRGAYFANPDAVTNILTRVTGSNISEILGTLGVLGDANLFLINPNGITFGNDASLDLNGSFFASTADSLIFENGFEFSASNPEAPPLLTVNIPVGLRFRDNAGDIVMETDAAPPPVVANEEGDAGQLLDTSQSINNGSSSPPNQITGELDNGNDADLYEVFLPEGTTITPSTVGGSDVDTRLFLFDEQGLGRAANDDSGGTFQSALSDFTATESGVVYVGVAGFAKAPLSTEGEIFTFNSSEADGPGAGQPLSNWNDSGFSDGAYTLTLSDVPEPPSTSLEVSPGQTLALIGGKVSLDGKEIISPDSKVAIGGLSTAGVVTINPDLSLSYPAGVTQGNVNLRNEAAVNVRGNSGGKVTINGRNVNLDNVGLRVGIDEGLGSPDAVGDNIEITATDGINIVNGTIISNAITSNGQGTTGNINLNSSSVTVSSASQISTVNVGQGTIGNVNITADTVSLTEEASVSSQTAGNGSAGDVNIQASSLSMLDGGQINTTSFSDSDAGNINLNAQTLILNDVGFFSSIENANNLAVAGNINIEATRIEATNSQLVNDVSGSGNGGNVTVNADIANLDDTQIFSGIRENGTGNGGTVTFNILDTLTLNNESQIFSSLENNASGNAGEIIIRASSLTVDNDSIISVETSGNGDAGNIDIQAGTVAFRNTSTASTRVGLTGNGDGGNIDIQADTVELTEGSNLTVSASQGNAGNVTITASETVRLEGDGEFGGINSSLLNPTAQTQGNAGDITITTGFLEITKGAALDSSSNETGQGGEISIIATDRILFDAAETTEDGVAVVRTAIAESGIGDGGEITIQARLLEVRNNAFLDAGISGQGNGGNINLTASEKITFADGLFTGASSNVVTSSGEAIGDGGDITITSGSLELINGADISSSTLGEGNGGNIIIEASEKVKLDGSLTGLFSEVLSATAQGNGGDISINTQSLEVMNQAEISTTVSGKGNAGNITISANDSVSLSNLGKISSNIRNGATGEGGDLAINANTIELDNGSLVTTSTSGQGNAGNVLMTASDTLALSNSSVLSSGVNANNQNAEAEGNAGRLEILANSLELNSGSQLNASTNAKGDAGNIIIEIDETTSLNNSSILSTVDEQGQGQGAEIRINTPNLFLSNSFLATSSEAEGNAGNINITANEAVVFDDSFIATTTFDDFAAEGGEITVNTPELQLINETTFITSTEGSGQAGNIIINGETLELTGLSSLLTSVITTGNAGNITLNLTDSLALTNSAIQANTTPNSTGEGGNINIDPELVTLDNSSILVNSEGAGDAGNIFLVAGDLLLDNQSAISAETASGEGGNINLSVADLLRLDNNSPINTTAGGTGNGGDITINSQLIVANDNSDIRANAFEGTGGNINLTAQGLFFSPDSEIDASSDLGIDGVVETNTPDVDPAEGLIELESDVVDAAELIAQNVCEQTEDSEFVITGKGGLPPNPDDFQVPENTEVDLILPSDSSTNSTQSDVSTVDSLLVEKIVPARGLIVDENGQATLVGYDVNQGLSQRQKKTFNSCLPN